MTRWYSTKGAGRNVSIDDEPYTGFEDDALMAMSPAEWEAAVKQDRERIEQRHQEQAAILRRRR